MKSEFLVTLVLLMLHSTVGFWISKGKYERVSTVFVSRKYYDPFIPVEENPVFDLDLSPKTARNLRSKIRRMYCGSFPVSAFKKYGQPSIELQPLNTTATGRSEKVLRNTATIKDVRSLIANTTAIKKVLEDRKRHSRTVDQIRSDVNITQLVLRKELRESQVNKAIRIVIGKRRARNGGTLVDPEQVTFIRDLLAYDVYANYQKARNATIPLRGISQRLSLISHYRTVFQRNCTKAGTMSLDTFVSLIDFRTESALLAYYQALVLAIVRHARTERGITPPRTKYEELPLDLEEFLFLRLIVEDDVFADRPLNRNDRISTHSVNRKLLGCYSIDDAVRDRILTIQQLDDIVNVVMGKRKGKKDKLVITKKKQRIILELILIAIDNNTCVE